jgi:hypothetical protein
LSICIAEACAPIMVSVSSGLPCLMAATRCERALDEALVDRLLDQRAARAGADLALVEGEQHQALDGLVEEVVVGRHHVVEEHVGALAAQLQRGRDQVGGGRLRDHLAGGGAAGEGDLGDALAGGQRVPASRPKPLTMLSTPGGSRSAISSTSTRMLIGRALGGLEHHAVAGAQRRRQLPGRHQDREVPGDDLADHAERLVEVVGDGVGVDLAERPFLRAHAAGEVAEVVDRQRDVGVQRLADRLAVVDVSA